MPTFRNHTVLEFSRNVRLFFRVEVRLTGLGRIPGYLRPRSGIRSGTRTASPQEDGQFPAASPKAESIAPPTRKRKPANKRGSGAVPGSEQRPEKQAQSRTKNKNGQLEQTPEQEQLEGRIDALDAKRSETVSGIEPGSVPAKETFYLDHPFVYPYDSDIGEIIARGGEWDAVLRTVVSELLTEEEPTIYEVGGNIGASLLQILAAKPHARVVTFEPSARFRPYLEHNLKLAGFDRDQVEVFPMLVGREPGSMWLYRFTTTASTADVTHLGHEPRGKELVEMTTLDEISRDRGPVDFIKVDADGFDFEVLRGAEATLKRDRPILHFEFAPRYLVEAAPSAPVEELAWLQSVGYRQLVCLDPAGQLLGTTDDPEQVLAWANTHPNFDMSYCDVLTCPEGSASEARLESIEFG